MNQSYIGLQLTGYQGQSITILSYFEKFKMYQVTETKGNITNTPLYSELDIQDLIKAQSKINESINTTTQLKAAEEKTARLETERESIGNFLIHNPKQHSRAKNTLNTLIKYNGTWTTRKEYAEQLANSNENIETTIYKGKYQYRFVNESSLLEITKTEADYFNYLKGNTVEVKEIAYAEI